MTASSPAAITTFTPALTNRVFHFVARVAGDPELKLAVEANHDENRWWPATVSDWRLRMALAGWSTRVSYNMVATYAEVAAEADRLGFDCLAGSPDNDLVELVRPLGLASSRVRYLRSLAAFLERMEASGVDVVGIEPNELIRLLASSVHQASYKVAQCAVLYARGYHCGVIPVDSGMVTKLAPCLDIQLSRGSMAHQEMRALLERCVCERAADYRELAHSLDYAVTIPDGAPPTWWAHLVLIYFKRLYCNRPSPRLCPRRPSCRAVLDCCCTP
jgi:hypothetical protein